MIIRWKVAIIWTGLAIGAVPYLLAPPESAGAVEGEEFTILQVRCQNKPPTLEWRSRYDVNMAGEACRERIVALVSPATVGNLATPTARGSEEMTILHKLGWPRTLANYSGGPLTIANLGDTQGLATVIQNPNGTVHALAPTGESLNGWPVSFETNAIAAVAAVDLVGDSSEELVLADAALHVLSSSGEPLTGWPFIGAGFLGHIPIGAQMSEGGPVRVVSTGALPPPITGNTSGAFVLDEAGNPLPGWPAIVPKGRFPRPFTQGPAVGDTTGDATAEIIITVANESQVWAFNASGKAVSRFPIGIGRILDDPSLGDLDGDGVQEIVFWTDQTDPENVGTRGVIVLSGNGTVFPGWPQITKAIGNFGPALGDVDGDGLPEVVVSTVGGTGGVYAWHNDGSSAPGWPKFVEFTTFPNPPSIADVDGDGNGDVIVARATTILPSNGVIYAWKGSGELIDGFPIVIPFRPFLANAAPTIADIDGDGIAELGVASLPSISALHPARIHWFDLGVPYRPEGMQWPTWAHDHARTGSYSPPVRRVGMELGLSPPILNATTPAPKMKVEVMLPAGETAAPTSIMLVKVDGAAVEPISGALKGQEGGAAKPSKKLKFEFDGEEVKAVLGDPGSHTLTFRSEVIGGVGGIQFEGDADLQVIGRGQLEGWPWPGAPRPF